MLNRAPPLLYHRVLRDGVRLLARICSRRRRARDAPSPGTAISCRSSRRWKLRGGRRRVAASESRTRRRLGGATSSHGPARGARESAPPRRRDLRDAARGHGPSLDSRARAPALRPERPSTSRPTFSRGRSRRLGLRSAIDRLTQASILPAAFGARFRRIAGLPATCSCTTTSRSTSRWSLEHSTRVSMTSRNSRGGSNAIWTSHPPGSRTAHRRSCEFTTVRTGLDPLR